MFLRKGASLLLQLGEAGLQSSCREPSFSWAFSPGHFGPCNVGASGKKIRGTADRKQRFLIETPKRLEITVT
jgi:hypothetical protein